MNEQTDINALDEAQAEKAIAGGKERSYRNRKKKEKRGELSTTKPALNTIQKLRDGVEEAIIDFIDRERASAAKVKSTWLVHLENNPTDVTAELALRVCLDAVGADWTRNNTVLHLGEALNASILNFYLRKNKEGRDLLKTIETANKNEGGSVYTMRERAIHIATKKKHKVVRDSNGKAVLDDDGKPITEEDSDQYHWEQWADTVKVKVGGIMLSAVLKGAPNVFVEDTTKEQATDQNVKTKMTLSQEAEEILDAFSAITITDEAYDAMEAEGEWLDTQSPMHSPMFNKPRDWGKQSTGPYNQLSLNILTPPVKHMSPSQDKAIRDGMLDGSLDEALEALNTIQGVPYAINEHVVRAVWWARSKVYQSNGELEISSFPALTKVEVPHLTKEEYEALSEDDQFNFYSEQLSCKRHNREVPSNKLTMARRLREAVNLVKAKNKQGIDRFYLPHQWDSRGRVYHTPDFGHHNTDYTRAMFLFANKGKLTEKNVHRLYQHLANCFGQKIDKEPMEKRWEWAKANRDKILAVGADYKDETTTWDKVNPVTGEVDGTETPFDYWRTADEPFQFLAACREFYNYTQHGEGYETGLPIALDACQSGIMLYAAIARNREDGIKVNLTDNEVPQDLYLAVVDKAIEINERQITELQAIEERTEAEEKDLRSALQWKDHGIERKHLKQPTMTWAYSSDLYGFAKQIMNNVMKSLSTKKRQGKIAKHPFGDDGGFAASWYMAKVAKEAIEDTVTSAKAGMEYIQYMANLCYQNNLHLHFKTPMNFPMMQFYRDYKKSPTRIEMPLWDVDAQKIRKDKANLRNYTDDIRQSKSVNASSPNFIHSLDATLLMMATLKCKSMSITDLMLVHDSFSTTIDNVDVMDTAIKSSLIDLFTDYCPYEALLQQTMQRIADEAPLPDIGELDLGELMRSKYAFS